MNYYTNTSTFAYLSLSNLITSIFPFPPLACGVVAFNIGVCTTVGGHLRWQWWFLEERFKVYSTSFFLRGGPLEESLAID